MPEGAQQSMKTATVMNMTRAERRSFFSRALQFMINPVEDDSPLEFKSVDPNFGHFGWIVFNSGVRFGL